MWSILNVLVVAIVALVLLQAQSISAQKRQFSYICLSAENRLCLGLSTQTDPVYDPAKLIHLQLKVREKVEEKGLDYLKTRWTVFGETGQIQLANFTSLCVARRMSATTTPMDTVLRPCGAQAANEEFELSAFFDRSFNDSALRLKAFPDQCLTVMNCDRRTEDFCSYFETKPYTRTTMDPTILRGAFVKFLPCANLTSQVFTQTIDCAPGCSPFMMEGPDNTCDPACANDACNWDNGACATPAPTPPTFTPTRSPSIAPTTTPTTSPTTSKPSVSPTTSQPSSSPTSPSPSTSPSVAPSSVRSSPPSVASEPPTLSPTASVTTNTTATPTMVAVDPTATVAPTGSRANQGVSSDSGTSVGQSLWWVWLILCIVAVLLLLCAVCVIVPMLRKKWKKEEEQAAVAAAKGVPPPSSPAAAPEAGAAVPPPVGNVVPPPMDDLAIEDRVEAQQIVQQ